MMRLVKCATNRMEPVCRAISAAFHVSPNEGVEKDWPY